MSPLAPTTTEIRILRTLSRHTPALLDAARRYSGCPDDAQDAYQRAVEIYLRRVSTLPEGSDGAWLHAVCRHEALEVRRLRRRDAPPWTEPHAAPDPEERVQRREEVRRAAAALARCPRDEAAALVLQAAGLSYREIGERRGWSQTKVNRCLTEGRRRFLASYAQLGADGGPPAPFRSRPAPGCRRRTASEAR